MTAVGLANNSLLSPVPLLDMLHRLACQLDPWHHSGHSRQHLRHHLLSWHCRFLYNPASVSHHIRCSKESKLVLPALSNGFRLVLDVSVMFRLSRHSD